MGNVWAFTILYLGVIAGVLAVLAAVIWYCANRYRRAGFEELLAGALGAEDRAEGREREEREREEREWEEREWEERLARLEARVDALWETVRHPPAAKGEPPADQAQPLRRCRNLVLVQRDAAPETPASAAAGDAPPAHVNLRERIYNGFKQGKTITDLARESGRGKGEIELIINLRRATGTGGNDGI